MQLEKQNNQRMTCLHTASLSVLQTSLTPLASVGWQTSGGRTRSSSRSTRTTLTISDLTESQQRIALQPQKTLIHSERWLGRRSRWQTSQARRNRSTSVSCLATPLRCLPTWTTSACRTSHLPQSERLSAGHMAMQPNTTSWTETHWSKEKWWLRSQSQAQEHRRGQWLQHIRPSHRELPAAWPNYRIRRDSYSKSTSLRKLSLRWEHTTKTNRLLKSKQIE